MGQEVLWKESWWGTNAALYTAQGTACPLTLLVFSQAWRQERDLLGVPLPLNTQHHSPHPGAQRNGAPQEWFAFWFL